MHSRFGWVSLGKQLQHEMPLIAIHSRRERVGEERRATAAPNRPTTPSKLAAILALFAKESLAINRNHGSFRRTGSEKRIGTPL
jgi:hypothetical protein